MARVNIFGGGEPEKEDWEIESEKRKEQAAGVLVDEVWLIGEKLKNAHLLLQGIQEDYFGKYDFEREKDRIGIWWEFPNNARYVNMVHDYVCQAERALAALYEAGARKATDSVEGDSATKG